MTNTREENLDNLTSLESRMTSGPISTIINPELVERVGFVEISQTTKNENGSYRNSLIFCLDVDEDLEDFIFPIDDHLGLLSPYFINVALNRSKLYLAHFGMYQYPHNHLNNLQSGKAILLGSGDIYREKDIYISVEGVPLVTTSGLSRN